MFSPLLGNIRKNGYSRFMILWKYTKMANKTQQEVTTEIIDDGNNERSKIKWVKYLKAACYSAYFAIYWGLIGRAISVHHPSSIIHHRPDWDENISIALKFLPKCVIIVGFGYEKRNKLNTYQFKYVKICLKCNVFLCSGIYKIIIPSISLTCAVKSL